MMVMLIGMNITMLVMSNLSSSSVHNVNSIIVANCHFN